MPNCTDGKNVVWQLIYSAGGIPNRQALKDIIFLSQEYNIFNSLFSFTPCAGLGTSRHSDEIDTSVNELLKEGCIFDTGGPNTLKTLKAPKPACQQIHEATQLMNAAHIDDLSMLAAFKMAIKRETQIGQSQTEKQLKNAAAARVGWPLDIFEQIENQIKKQLGQ